MPHGVHIRPHLLSGALAWVSLFLAVLPVRRVFSAVLPFSIRMGLLELEVGTAPVWAQAAWAGEGAHEGTRRGLALPSPGPRLLPALQSPLSCFILSPDLVHRI